MLRHVDAIVRGLAAHVKAAIAKMLDGQEPDDELDKLNQFVEQVGEKFQTQSCRCYAGEPSLELLKSYFSSALGIALCDQTAFPSLVVDFVGKMRVFAMKEELLSLVQGGSAMAQVHRDEGADRSTTPCVDAAPDTMPTTETLTGVFAAVVPSLELLMNCVVAIASNGTLMETYRCELPNLIGLTAEEYPPVALFIRDSCSRALTSVPDRNFNAALAWYLLDCSVIVKAVGLMTSYSLATVTTPETAVRALENYLIKLPDHSGIYGGSADRIEDSTAAAAAAAVSEALGLTRSAGGSLDRRDASTSIPSPFASSHDEAECDREAEPPSVVETFCLSSYDVRFGMKSVLYILERASRFTLALLDEFQTSGGYTLLLRLLDTCTEEEIPGLLDMLTLLMPLGARSADIPEGMDRALGSTFGARNVHAFAVMRDLLLNYVTGQDQMLNAAIQRRNEHLILQLLTQILHIYTSDYENFAFLEPRTRTLALLLMKLSLTTFYDAQVIILRIVEYVCCAAQPEDPLAHEILSIVCGLLVACNPLSSRTNADMLNPSSDASSPPSTSSIPTSPESMLTIFEEGPTSTLATLMCECLIKVLRDCGADVYKQKLSGFGLMDRGVYVWLGEIAACLSAVASPEISTSHKLLTALKPHLDIYGRILCLMLRNNMQECIRFREIRAHQSLYLIADAMIVGDVLATPFDMTGDLHLDELNLSVMSTFAEMARNLGSEVSPGIENMDAPSISLLKDGVESDLSYILESLQRYRGAVWRQIILLYILVEMLSAGERAISPLWKACQGYEILGALLSSFDFVNDNSDGRLFVMMELVLKTLSITLDSRYGDRYNAEYFRSITGYSTVASCIQTSGVLGTSKREVVLNHVFDLISGGAQHNSIHNGEAVQILFSLLPMLPTGESINVMKKLLSLLGAAESAAILSKRQQVVRVVHAGVFQWMCEPQIVSKLINADEAVQPFLTRWIVAVTLEENLAVPCLHEFFRLAGKTMPKLLGAQRYSPKEPLVADPSSDIPETGLLLLRNVLRNPAIRHAPVGKPQGLGLTGRYVHVVNSADRVWPPSSGYSFLCWLRFPALPFDTDTQSDTVSASDKSIVSPSSAMPASLCEGYLRITRDEDRAEPIDVYGVLVDVTLKLFASKEHSARNADLLDVLTIRNITRTGPLEWSFWAKATPFRASCPDDNSMSMWWRAMELSTNLGHNAEQSKVNAESNINSNDSLLSSFGPSSNGSAAEPSRPSDVANNQEEGSACIVSIYSMESSGCFVRVFFEHSTGFLRFHTGSVNTGPSINPNPKRTSVVFDSVAIDDLRATRKGIRGCSTKSQVEPKERKRDWHHLAFTHRKSVVGSSLITVYIDGQEVATKKLNFPSAPSTGSFQAFVGSDAQVCSPHSALSWNAGPTWLSDDVMSSRSIAGMFSLGPTFTHQFSGHSYRSVGDFPEALANSHLARAADRGIEIAEFARRLQLVRLGRSCQRKWRELHNVQISSNESVSTGAALIAESMIAKKDELSEGLRLAAGGNVGTSRKEANKAASFRNFISYGCDPSTFGSEIDSLLGGCKLPEDTILFALNTSCGDRSSTPILAHTQVHYTNTAQSCRLDLARSLPSVGGVCQVIFPLFDSARRQCDFNLVLRMLVDVLRRNPSCLAECIGCNGYTFISAILCSRVALIDDKMLVSIVRLAVAGKLVPYANSQTGTSTRKQPLAHPVIVDARALAQIVLSVDLRKKLPHHLQCQLVSLLMDLLVTKNPNALFNARQLRRAGLTQWILTYLTDLCNEDCHINQATALEMRWCFPKFTDPMFEAILQYALSLLRAFLRAENHVDDFQAIADVMLLSMTSTIMHTRTSPIRVVLLQFILHEVENDTQNHETNDEAGTASERSTERISSTIVESILNREGIIPVNKKRDEKRADNGNQETAPLSSPPGENSSKLGKSGRPPYPVDGLANVLLEVIGQGAGNGLWISTEALLAVRVLFSLAQEHNAFAEHLLCQSALVNKLKRVLRLYSIDCCAFIPLLAYASSIPIGDTIYHDPDILSASLQPASSKVVPTLRLVDQVWDIIGEMLLKNCRDVNIKAAQEISVVVLGKIALQVKTSMSFFRAVCKSSGTIFRVVMQCLLCGMSDTGAVDDNDTLAIGMVNVRVRLMALDNTDANATVSIIDACLNLICELMTRALYGSDDFGSLMILTMESLDERISKQAGSTLSRQHGQRCWLELLKHIVKKEQALTSNITLVSLKNICTLCVALSRYLADTDNHHIIDAVAAETTKNAVGATAPTTDREASCIGVEALEILLNFCEMCSHPDITQSVGTDEQRFFYGSLIYSAQTVVLIELGGPHRNILPSTKLLELLVQSKHILLQVPTWEGVMECGIGTQTSSNDAGGNTEPANAALSGGRPRRMHRIRSLSANAHKEFGIGAESDRSFILSLSAILFRMLMNDSNMVRHSAIVLWQFLIDQRFDALKELLIAEPRTSLLHTITSTKKEVAVDVFHGGFDRLLYVLHTQDADNISNPSNISLNQEIWCQFQLWLAENDSLLADLIVTRTEAIYRHGLEVLQSCICLRNVSGAGGVQEISIEIDFPIRVDGKTAASSNDYVEELDPERREMIARKTLVEFSSLRDSELEAMNDGLSRWRETSMRLTYTRNIWHTGKWQLHGLDGNVEVVPEEQRSVFQRRSLGYCLDTTEGPQRMRMRLVRNYITEENARQATLPEAQVGKQSDIEAKPQTTDDIPTSAIGSFDGDPFRRSLEFHDAVEVFHEFVYRLNAAEDPTETIAQVLQCILSQCKMSSTRDFFADIVQANSSAKADAILAMGLKVYSSFLGGNESNSKRSMGVSSSLIADIDRLITAATEKSEDQSLLSTLFDAADAEATQYALCAVQSTSLGSLNIPLMIAMDTELEGSGDEGDEDIPMGSVIPLDDAESGDSDGAVEENMTDVLPSVAKDESGLISIPAVEPISSRSEMGPISKEVGTSCDALYGSIARFLHRDDYPPMRSYNAAYIAGMGRIPGLFAICRLGLYFIGGYAKVYNSQNGSIAAKDDSGKAKSVFSFENDPTQTGSKSTSTPTGGRRKTTKRLLRAALNDLSMQFVQPKSGGEQFFSVLPLLSSTTQPGEQANGSTPAFSTSAIVSRWSIKYLSVRQFCRIKYQLRPVGIEFFDTFGSTYFIQLETPAEREEVVKLLFQMPLINSIFWSPVLRTGALAPSTKRIRQAVTKRWLRGSISNFEYLIHLNTLAGRSFNDITQYPVFPWVIADYTSEFLDLDARDTFRDLSKPMGAIGETRAAQFYERYLALSQDMDTDGSMGTPAFHYGTHYSCSAYVINYLIRLEPFTDLALELQGGVFDHPDRLFRSIPSSWTSASRDNLQDVRELIPEFFYLPEFLYNANNCKFGTTQSGEEVCHVILPPWAHGDPREFVRINRRALESKYVSEHIHEWIDLVFGVKQTGQAAVDAQNVFMHFTYEGTVDIDQIEDPVMRAATLAQIENFGQTPTRLFSSPHPQRKVPTLQSPASDTSSTPSMNPSAGHQYDGITLSTIEAYVKWHTPLSPALVSIGKDYVFLKKHSAVAIQVNGSAIGDVRLSHDKMQCQGFGCTFMPPRFAKYLDWGNNSGVMKLRIHQQSSASSRYREGNKVLAVIEGAHQDDVNSAAISDDGVLLVTGGQDAVVNLIECSKASDGRRIFKQMAKFIGHTDAVSCVAINKEFNLVASSSADRSVLLWDLRTRALLQELAGHSTTVVHVSINGANGNVLTATSSELRLWSINGDLLAASSSSMFGLQAITCAISTRCEAWQSGVVAVTGHMNGAIALWGLRYPSDLARQSKDNEEIESPASSKHSQVPVTPHVFSGSPSSSRRNEGINMPVSIQNQGTAPSVRNQVVPSCQLFILKLLLDHRAKVTALTLGPEQRQLLSGDAEGNCIRWVDDSISSNIH